MEEARLQHKAGPGSSSLCFFIFMELVFPWAYPSRVAVKVTPCCPAST